MLLADTPLDCVVENWILATANAQRSMILSYQRRKLLSDGLLSEYQGSKFRALAKQAEERIFVIVFGFHSC